MDMYGNPRFDAHFVSWLKTSFSLHVLLRTEYPVNLFRAYVDLSGAH